ncbi:UPF0722 protein-like protein [Corchorus olitorius]|uniref:UPF0722 protein-like protein n=1 Tax=Corchorus olitorius TaxID=93759 RepID=A0A1R3G357_9ROSI|nr:UPF0722 protein-like protein [Corchorus olitorius]
MGHSEKDRDSRARATIWKKQLVGELLSKILGKDLELQWKSNMRHDIRTGYVKDAIEYLQNPQLVLRLLEKSMQPLDLGVGEKNALQVLATFLAKSIIGPSHEVHDESPADSIPQNSIEIPQIHALKKEAQKKRKYTESFGESFEEINAILNGRQQSAPKEWRNNLQAIHIVSNVLEEVVKKAAEAIKKQESANQLVQQHQGLDVSIITEIVERQLIIKFPTFKPAQINQNGENIVIGVHDKEVIDEGKQVDQEVNISVGLEAGRLVELKVGTNQETGSLKIDSTDNEGIDWNEVLGKGWENFLTSPEMEFLGGSTSTQSDDIWKDLGFGTPDYEICIVQGGFKVLKRNADTLTEILQVQPNIAENYQDEHPDLQSPFMNSIAELYLKLKGTQEMQELENLEEKMQQIECINQQLITWMKEKVEDTRERLMNEAEMKRLQDDVDRAQQRLDKFKQTAERKSKKLRLE